MTWLSGCLGCFLQLDPKPQEYKSWIYLLCYLLPPCALPTVTGAWITCKEQASVKWTWKQKQKGWSWHVAYRPSIQEVEAGELQKIWGLAGLQITTLPWKQNKQIKTQETMDFKTSQDASSSEILFFFYSLRNRASLVVLFYTTLIIVSQLLQDKKKGLLIIMMMRTFKSMWYSF